MIRLLPVLVASLVLVACGDETDSTSATGTETATSSHGSGLTDDEAKTLFKSTFFVEKSCSKIDLGPVPGADKPYGVGATSEDIARLEDEVDARVDEAIELFESADDPNAELAPFEGATAKSLMQGPILALRMGCGSNGARWALKIEDALDEAD